MRSVSIGVPSGRVFLTLWEGTEDEEKFEVRSLKRGRPYVKAYGLKYELTEEEIGVIRAMTGAVEGEASAMSAWEEMLGGLKTRIDGLSLALNEKEVEALHLDLRRMGNAVDGVGLCQIRSEVWTEKMAEMTDAELAAYLNRYQTGMLNPFAGY